MYEGVDKWTLLFLKLTSKGLLLSFPFFHGHGRPYPLYSTTGEAFSRPT